MKTKLQTNPPDNTLECSHPQPGKPWRNNALLGAAFAVALVAVQPAMAGDIFVIAMENHNFTQPNPVSSPQQIFANPAAPFINSLITPGNPNAAHVSYATAYYNAGKGVHPSEPNYVWAEAGSDFGFHSDADPNPASGNTFYDHAIHLTAQLDAAGVSWKNYQEDVQLSASPTNSAAGTNGPLNPFYGTAQYNYAVKHNPMAFFADTALENVFPLAQLFQDLNSQTTGRYNWITPNQFNDAHSALTGGFNYMGTHFTGDQASIAQGDNFLATIVPEIMASKAYQDNGTIIIWWDETEGGDNAGFTIPEIIISPLAKGNAYASTVPLSHSSDIKTIEELFGLPFINNAIPLAETNVQGGFSNVALASDLSDMFVPGTIPAAPNLSVTPGHLEYDRHTDRFVQQMEIKNTGTTSVPAPFFLVLDNLSANATLINSGGLKTTILAPLGSPYVSVNVRDHDHDGDDNVLPPHGTKIVNLEFINPSGAAITFDTRVLPVTPTP
ncbi:MAG: hypothetical protein JWR19_5 [Pedosphaera sp.]|nr:hypothetical protein [Pedosphaera sp.]